MREILFRGQTRRRGEKVRMDGTPVESNWVYGGIFQGQNMSVIYGYKPIEKHVVYSETVGEYTGLQDKHGKRIFEGDIVRVDLEEPTLACLVGKICFTNGCYMISPVSRALSLYAYHHYCTVIGNIHDNLELLKEDSNA